MKKRSKKSSRWLFILLYLLIAQPLSGVSYVHKAYGLASRYAWSAGTALLALQGIKRTYEYNKKPDKDAQGYAKLSPISPSARLFYDPLIEAAGFKKESIALYEGDGRHRSCNNSIVVDPSRLSYQNGDISPFGGAVERSVFLHELGHLIQNATQLPHLAVPGSFLVSYWLGQAVRKAIKPLLRGYRPSTRIEKLLCVGVMGIGISLRSDEIPGLCERMVAIMCEKEADRFAIERAASSFELAAVAYMFSLEWAREGNRSFLQRYIPRNAHPTDYSRTWAFYKAARARLKQEQLSLAKPTAEDAIFVRDLLDEIALTMGW